MSKTFLCFFFPHFYGAAFFVFLDMVVHPSGHVDCGLDVRWAMVNLSFSHMWPFWKTFLQILESCESDPVFRDRSVSIDVSIIVNAAFLQMVQICKLMYFSGIGNDDACAAFC